MSVPVSRKESILISLVCLILSGRTAEAANSAALDYNGNNNAAPGAQTNWPPGEDSWNYWWSYSGVSGPSYWGLLNADWFMCDRGRHQSPVNIETKWLVYDPHLKPLRADNNLISGILLNDGHAIVFNGSLAAQRLLQTSSASGGGSFADPSNLFGPHGGNPADLDRMAGSNGTSDGQPEPLGGKLKRRQADTSDSRLLPPEAPLKMKLTGQQPDSGAGAGLFLMADSLNGDQHQSGHSANLMVGNLTRSIELSVQQSNQLESGAILEQLNSDAMIESRLDGAGLDGLSAPAGLAELTSEEQQASMSVVHLSGAGLAYSYQFEALYLRFGHSAGGPHWTWSGSEHRINSRAYPAELQLLAYNSDLFKSFAEASTKPNGLLGVAVLVEALQGPPPASAHNQQQAPRAGPPLNGPAAETMTTRNGVNKTNGPSPNDHLEALIRDHLSSIQHRGGSAMVRGLNLIGLLPETSQFVTYSGSLTQPGCHESVDWLILNRPLYISQASLEKLRLISADEQSATQTGTFIAGNTRPTQPINNRPMRTNIRPPTLDNGKGALAMDASERENLSPLDGARRRLVKRQSAANSDSGSIAANTNESSCASKLDDDHQSIWAGPKRNGTKLDQKYYGPMANEQLLDGFMLLRLMQLLNIDIYYIGLVSGPQEDQSAVDSESRQSLSKNEPLNPSLQDLEAGLATEAAGLAGGKSANRLGVENPLANYHDQQGQEEEEGGGDEENERQLETREPNIMEEVSQLNPFNRLIDRSRFLQALCRCLKIFFSLIALLFSFDKSLSTILLCLLAKINSTSPSIGIKAPSVGMTNEASDISMSWFVLILVNLSSSYIMYSTIFNGHLLWSLLSQRLFLVSRRFQYKTMLSLLVFVYLDYVINIAFINNLFGWSMIKSDLGSEGPLGGAGGADLYGSYSVLNGLRKIVTEQDEEHHLVDVALTINQFARGLIRISPYLTINYVIICLVEHIKTIRNQSLLTDSLKKRQKLRLVVKNRRANLRASRISRQSRLSVLTSNVSNAAGSASGSNLSNNKKKRVIFATETSGAPAGPEQAAEPWPAGSRQLQVASPTESPAPSSLGNRSASSLSDGRLSNLVVLGEREPGLGSAPGLGPRKRAARPGCGERARRDYLGRVRDFDELESYVTNLYIFTGRLNRLMSRQGLAMYFIVHNLVISCALIVPEAIRGGPPMVVMIRLIVIVVGIVPFVCGQSLNDQLEQLSKQIDRIIIQQQFTNRRRDNLVRIRELLHDIRVNCGGMLNFNVETGIKYLVVAFASAFFIEQEGEYSRGGPRVGAELGCREEATNQRHRPIDHRRGPGCLGANTPAGVCRLRPAPARPPTDYKLTRRH